MSFESQDTVKNDIEQSSPGNYYTLNLPEVAYFETFIVPEDKYQSKISLSSYDTNLDSSQLSPSEHSNPKPVQSSHHLLKPLSLLDMPAQHHSPPVTSSSTNGLLGSLADDGTKNNKDDSCFTFSDIPDILLDNDLFKFPAPTADNIPYYVSTPPPSGRASPPKGNSFTPNSKRRKEENYDFVAHCIKEKEGTLRNTFFKQGTCWLPKQPK